MEIGVVGTHASNAALFERESFLRTLEQVRLPFSSVLLETCERVELYFAPPCLQSAFDLILSALQHVPVPRFTEQGASCFTHLTQVAAGLKSALFGESDIQRQVKQAYERARIARTLPSALHFLFQKSLKVAKEVRAAFLLTASAPQLEHAVFERIISHFGHWKEMHLLFVGLSSINRKALKLFQSKGVRHMTLCSRLEDEAMRYACSHDIRCLPWNRVHTAPTFDAVVVATSTRSPLLSDSLFAPLNKPIVVCDLSVPHAVERTVQERSNVRFYDIEALTEHLKGQSGVSTQVREEAVRYVLERVQRQVEVFARKERVCASCFI